MEKLTKEHLAAYLFWGVECVVIVYGKTKIIPLNERTIRSITFHLKVGRSVKLKLKPLSELEADSEEEKTPEYLKRCTYLYVQYLLSEHYDIYGLIDKGLAINKNNVNNK